MTATSVGSPTSLGKGVEIVEERPGRGDGVVYRLQRVRCGKERCVCAHGPGHGPYWYACWNDGGKHTRTRYIGKEFKWIKRPPRRVTPEMS